MNMPCRFEHVHGDEDWSEPPTDYEIREATNEIIQDAELLESQLNDEELASPISDILCSLKRAAEGHQDAINALIRGAHQLEKVVVAMVEDKAYELASERMTND